MSLLSDIVGAIREIEKILRNLETQTGRVFEDLSLARIDIAMADTVGRQQISVEIKLSRQPGDWGRP